MSYEEEKPKPIRIRINLNANPDAKPGEDGGDESSMTPEEAKAFADFVTDGNGDALLKSVAADRAKTPQRIRIFDVALEDFSKLFAEGTAALCIEGTPNDAIVESVLHCDVHKCVHVMVRSDSFEAKTADEIYAEMHDEPRRVNFVMLSTNESDETET